MKKLSKLLCVGVLASTMTFTLMPANVHAADEAGFEEGTMENVSKTKAEFENLNLVMRQFSMTDNKWGKVFPFDEFNLYKTYSLDFEDTVESKEISGFYHVTFKNISKDMIKIRVASNVDDTEFADVIESKDTGMMRHTSIEIVPLKAGQAQIECTIYDIANPSITRTEIVTLTINDIVSTPTIDFDVSYSVSEDFLVTHPEKQADVIDIINHANETASLGLNIKENLDTVTLPKDILEAAQEKNVSLTVQVEMNGKDNTWTFPKNIDNVTDVNLVMNVVKANEIESLKDKDGLVLAFHHDGILPTGTTLKTYVGDTYKAGSKVQLSYYNEKTNTLEETKEYVVDAEGYITVTIHHCSNYLLEKASDEVKPTPTPTPTPIPETSTGTETSTATTPVKNTGKVSVATSDNTNAFILLGLLSMSTIGLAAFRKKSSKI